MRAALIAAVAFGIGLAAGASTLKADTKRTEENAERYAHALAHCLNGGEIETKDVTAQCRVRRKD